MTSMLSPAPKERHLKLFLVQDSERSMYVLAYSYAEAIMRWQRQIGAENEGDAGPFEPEGVQKIAENADKSAFPEILLPQA